MARKSPLLSDVVKTFDDLFRIAHGAMTVLRHFSDEVGPLTADEIIERGLLFAKTNPTQQEVADAMLHYSFVELKDKIVSERPPPDTLLSALMWRDAKKQREDFRARLEEIIKSPNEAGVKHKAADMKLLRNELLVTGDIDDQGVGFCRFYPMTIEAGYMYVLQALYNKKQKRWKRLRKCGHCQSIFFRKISEAGGRPRDYCSPECQKKHDQEMALVRQRSPEQRAKQRQRKRDRK